MKNLVCLIIIFACVSVSSAQEYFDLYKVFPKKKNVIVGFNSSGEINSSSLTGTFLQGFLNGRKITTKDKENILSRSSDKNRIGFEINNHLFASWRGIKIFKKELTNSAFFIKVSDRQFLNASFSKDFVALGLNGNKQFAGKSADLGDFNLNFLRFQQYQAGWMIEGKRRTYGIGISYINGEQQLNIKSNRTLIKTSALGDELFLDMNLTANQSDTSHRKLGAHNASGTSVDLNFSQNFSVKFKNESISGKVKLSITDIGFIGWNNHSIRYNIDTTYSYRGTRVDDLFNLGDSVLSFVTPDSIYKDLTNKTYKDNHNTSLPVNFNLAVELANNDWQITLGGNHRMNANYVPYFYARPLHKFSQHVHAGGTIGYGGYGTFNFGFEGHFTFKYIQIGIGTRHIEGLVLPNSSAGHQAFLTLKTEI